MADILSGSTSHATFAPLSHGQTLSIAKHLQEQIDDLGMKFDGLHKELQHATESIKSVGTQLTNYSVDDLREQVTGIDTAVAGLRNDLGRTNGSVQRLQAEQEKANEAAAAMHEGQLMAENRVQKLARDLEQVAAKARDLGQVMQTRVFTEAQRLRDDLSKTNLQVDLLNQEVPTIKASLQEQKDALQTTDGALQRLRDDLAMSDTNAQVLEQRVAELNSSLKETRHTLQSTGDSLAQLTEDYRNTKQHLTLVHNGLKKTSSHVKQVHEGLNQTQHELRGARSKVDGCAETLDETRRSLQAEKEKVRNLRDGQEMAQAAASRLEGKLEETSAVLHETKKGLKETNSLVLPNLHLESTLPRGFGMGGDGRVATARERRGKPHSKERMRHA